MDGSVDGVEDSARVTSAEQEPRTRGGLGPFSSYFIYLSFFIDVNTVFIFFTHSLSLNFNGLSWPEEQRVELGDASRRNRAFR